MIPEVIAIKSAIELLVLWAFLYFFWRDYRIDAFRDHLFSIRDRLFKFAAEGGVEFSSPAYTMLRYRMNVFLRYAHEFTLLRALSIAFVRPLPAKSPERLEWEASLNGLPTESKERLAEFDTILTIAIIQLMLYRSFFLYLVIRPIVPFIRTRELLKNRPIVVTRVEQLEEEALGEDAQRPRHEMASVA
jgi:hypothetical protein